MGDGSLLDFSDDRAESRPFVVTSGLAQHRLELGKTVPCEPGGDLAAEWTNVHQVYELVEQEGDAAAHQALSFLIGAVLHGKELLAARDEAGRRMLAILVRATVAEDPDEWLADALACINEALSAWKETP